MSDVALTNIFLYPLKSARGIELAEAELDAFGLRHDRRWMAVDANGRMITQRQRPRMALVRTRLDDGRLVLNAPGLPPLSLPLEPEPGPRVRVSIWNDEVEAEVAGPEAAAWISEHLGTDARLVHMPDDAFRPVEQDFAVGDDDRVSFADAYPFLLVSAEALDELNARLDEPLPMNRFRPNFVVRGAGPHAEDGWRRIRIGGNDFHVVKACARCAITTTDQETAERGREPLRTLATYRRRNGEVLFGQNLIHTGPGRVRVGDAVEVVEAKDDARAEARVRTAEAVREACIRAALEAYEDAGIRGLCDEGAFEYAIDALRRLDVEAVVRDALRRDVDRQV